MNARPITFTMIQWASGSAVPLLMTGQPHHSGWASRHKAEYKFYTKQFHPNPLFGRYEAINKWLTESRHRDLALYADADTCIEDMNFDFRKVLPPDVDIGMCREKRSNFFNTGVIFLRNTPNVKLLMYLVQNRGKLERNVLSPAERSAGRSSRGFDPIFLSGGEVVQSYDYFMDEARVAHTLLTDLKDLRVHELDPRFNDYEHNASKPKEKTVIRAWHGYKGDKISALRNNILKVLQQPNNSKIGGT